MFEVIAVLVVLWLIGTVLRWGRFASQDVGIKEIREHVDRLSQETAHFVAQEAQIRSLQERISRLERAQADQSMHANTLTASTQTAAERVWLSRRKTSRPPRQKLQLRLHLKPRPN